MYWNNCHFQIFLNAYLLERWLEICIPKSYIRIVIIGDKWVDDGPTCHRVAQVFKVSPRRRTTHSDHKSGRVYQIVSNIRLVYLLSLKTKNKQKIDCEEIVSFDYFSLQMSVTIVLSQLIN
jgi:hypothetical protein